MKTKKSKDEITHCLWFFADSGTIKIDLIRNVPAEPVNIGGHVPYITGTEKEITRLNQKLEKKPYLIEKILKR